MPLLGESLLQSLIFIMNMNNFREMLTGYEGLKHPLRGKLDDATLKKTLHAKQIE